MIISRRQFVAGVIGLGAALPALASLPMKPIASVLDRLASQNNRYALLYFVQEGCPYCAKEQPIISAFSQRTGWYVKEVDIRRQPEVRTKFNVTNTPTIVLIKHDMDSRSWQPVSYGFADAGALVNSIYGITRVLNGEAPAQELNSLVMQGQSTSYSGEQQ
ncbi:thiol reductase thioredoxin (plasmid) [Pantoea sp. SGAir0184]|nr:conjugal transfer protein TraF [Enterobacter roggenkampii]